MPIHTAGPMVGGSHFEQFVRNHETGEQHTALA